MDGVVDIGIEPSGVVSINTPEDGGTVAAGKTAIKFLSSRKRRVLESRLHHQMERTDVEVEGKETRDRGT